MSVAPVRVRGVMRRFGRQLVLRGVSCEFLPGSCTLLLGANGAGKSTLLGILGTCLRPTRGEVYYGATEWAHVGPAQRSQIGLLGHRSLLYDELSALENLRFYGRLFGVAPERPAAVLAQVGLAGLDARPLRACSRGMVQRVALARALLARPELLLLDEPLTGLDGPSARRLLDTLLRYRREGGTLVVVTHRPAALRELADRALVLDQGRVARVVGPDALEHGFEALLDVPSGPPSTAVAPT